VVKIPFFLAHLFTNVQRRTLTRAFSQIIEGLSQGEAGDALKEAKLLQSLKHPNVVGYFDAFIQESQFVCIVMEYCRSTGVRRTLRLSRRIPLPHHGTACVGWTGRSNRE
jgi:serine/threonine protein kinase